MDLHSDLPFWTVRDGLLRVYPPLQADVRCDAVVLGAGITGALLAHALTEEGVETIVIDRRDVGYGSTSASTALLQYELDTPLHELLSRIDRAGAQRAYRLGVEAIERIGVLSGKECGFARRPSVLVARRAGDLPSLREEVDARKKAGLRVRFLEREELGDRFGITRAGGLYSSDAAEVNPYRLTHRLLRLAVKRGLRVYDRTEAKSYRHAGRGVVIRTDRGFTITAKRVFFATGYETQEFLPRRIVRFSTTYALVSEPLSDLSWWNRRALIWETGKSYLYTRTTSDGRVLVGGEDDEVQDPSRRDARLERKSARLLQRFARLFPDAPRLETAFAWGGAFGHTRDGLAYIGPHRAFPRGYFALGFGGNGITFSVTASLVLRDLFLGRSNPDAKIFRFER